MADINNFRQLDFQENGSPSNDDRVLIIRIDSSGVVTSALNYKVSDLKIFATADAQAKLEQIESIHTDINTTKAEVIEIRNTMEERISTIVGSAVTDIVYINGEQYAETATISDKGEPFTEYVKLIGD